MSQLPLFSMAIDPPPASADQRLALEDSERLLAMFASVRTAEGAHARSIKREMSQLRALVREAHMADSTVTVRTLFADPSLLAQVLREPTTVIARSTGRARLLAAQRFIQLVAPSLGHDPAANLAALDAHLPTQRSRGWHTTGTIVAGSAGRRRRRGPTLEAADLRHLIDVAGMEEKPSLHRNRALVALHCFPGLRPEEIVRLRWEDLDTELTVGGHYGLTAVIARGAGRVHLPLPEPVEVEIDALATSIGESRHSLTGLVLRSRSSPVHPLSYRAARDVLESACRRACLPPVDAASLRAACAHWLRSQGLSDHEVAAVLGLARVRSVDRLLTQHTSLHAQRTVRERLTR